MYLICEALMNCQKQISQDALENPRFELADWYDKVRAKHYHQKHEAGHHPDGRMGDALAMVAKRLLQSGVFVCYPNVRAPNNKERFDVLVDSDLLVPRCVLEDPTVSLVGLYIDKLEKRKTYKYWYVEEFLCVTDMVKEAKGLPTSYEDLSVQETPETEDTDSPSNLPESSSEDSPSTDLGISQ